MFSTLPAQNPPYYVHVIYSWVYRKKLRVHSLTIYDDNQHVKIQLGHCFILPTTTGQILVETSALRMFS